MLLIFLSCAVGFVFSPQCLLRDTYITLRYCMSKCYCFFFEMKTLISLMQTISPEKK